MNLVYKNYDISSLSLFLAAQGPFNKYRDWFQKSKFNPGIITIT